MKNVISNAGADVVGTITSVIVIVYVTNLLTNVWAFNTIVVASMGGGWAHAGSRGPALSPGLEPHCVVFLGRSLYSDSASLHPGV